MSRYNRFEVFTRTYGVQIQDTPAILSTNDASEALRACRAAMRREEGTLTSTSIRDVITGREYGGLEVFQFANEFALRVMD
jgi:hypothetical protein